MTQTRLEHNDNLIELNTFKEQLFKLEKKNLKTEQRLGERHSLWMKNMAEISN